MTEIIEADQDEQQVYELVNGFREWLITAGFDTVKIAGFVIVSGGALLMLTKGRDGAIAVKRPLALSYGDFGRVA